MNRSKEEIFKILQTVPDPEVPAISVVELGIVRDAEWEGETLRIDITPTYSGCPAMHQIEKDIGVALKREGISSFKVNLIYSPAWTTDWISEEAKKKLKAYGIAPPGKTAQEELISFPRKVEAVSCPFCNSANTKETSRFGATSCKALYYCNGCRQPFEYFKAF